jgi:hypothetical protein
VLRSLKEYSDILMKKADKGSVVIAGNHWVFS